MKFVLSAAFQPLDELAPIAQAADAHGYEAMAFSDHVAYPEVIDTPYPYTEDGSRRYDETSPFPDPWVAIGALAAVTKRLRFTNNVFVLAMRNPFIAAKTIGTASLLSKGRVTLTIGVGWSKVEFEMAGQEFRARGRRTDEMVEVMRKLWSGDWVEHRGEFYDFPRTKMPPAPEHPIPIWVGGFSEPALRRAARNDGWLSDLQTSADIARCIERVRAYRAEMGRAHLPLDVMASPSDAFTVDGFRKLEDQGVTHILTMPWVFYGGLTDDPQRKLDGLRRFADDVVAKMV
ncbi:MAG: LLM class F420-dependent oxidoreductase [Myxococcota bacterium]|nr:LLM class F420-dependent oxidoreductase [Myxococcales bacterium]